MKELEYLIVQYKLLTDWYLSALDNIAEENGSKIPSGSSNSLEWIAGHLITGRYRNIVRLGVKVAPYRNLDKFVNQTIPPPNAIAFDQKIKYPSLTECREEWKKYSTILHEALQVVDENVLRAELPFPVITGGKTVLDALVFVALHESYHVGQMSIIRKSLGYNSMQLSPRK